MTIHSLTARLRRLERQSPLNRDLEGLSDADLVALVRSSGDPLDIALADWFEGKTDDLAPDVLEYAQREL